MLVISRKEGEAVKLADNIEVIVVSIDGQRVRLGIKAPKDVKILRAELDPTTIQTNQKAAVNLGDKSPLMP
jgi:carbon storage regulator